MSSSSLFLLLSNVPTSDNKYVHYNLLADSFTTDVTQWAIDEGGVYVDNPEFIYVKLDAEDRILWAIKNDGNIYYGAGVPQQIIDYIQEKIEELSLVEIVDFLGNLINGDKTLQELLNDIEDRVPDVIESPEYINVMIDSENRILEGSKKDGTKEFTVDVKFHGNVEIDTLSVLNGFELSKKEYFNKKWTVVGDSLTEVNDTALKKYYNYIQESTDIKVYNMGVSGTGYKNDGGRNKAFYQRINTVPTDSDVVTIFGSCNDSTYFSNIGNISDTTTDTICGCINTTIDTLYTNFPSAVLGIISLTPTNHLIPGDEGVEAYVKALHDICFKRGIPFLDLFHCSGLRPWDATFRTMYYSRDNGGGTHPDENGQKLFAPRIRAFIDELIKY